MHGDEFAIDFDGEVLELVALDADGLLESHVVFVLAEDALDLLGVVVDALETVGGFKLGVFGEFLLETSVVLLLVEETGELAEFGDEVELLDLLVVFGAELSLVNEEGLLGVGDGEVVPLLVVFDQSLRGVVDLDVVHGTLGEIEVGDLVDTVVSVVSNDGLADDFLLDFVLFPAFLLEVEDIVEDGVLLEAAGDEVDLEEEPLLVEVHGSEETLDHGHVGLFHVGTLVFHHVVELGVAADFDHIEFTVGVLDHDFEELLHGEVFFVLAVKVVEVDFELELDQDFVGLAIFVLGVHFELIGVHLVGVHIEAGDPELADVGFDAFLSRLDQELALLTGVVGDFGADFKGVNAVLLHLV